jgi:hypothetical protein
VKIQWKKAGANLALLICSLLVAAVLCEFAARLVFDRVDVLSPKMVRDPILGIKLPPGSGGHDEWGFRNPTVPEQADIVALGDSHTYGNCAQMRESWPHVLGTLSSKSVYNLGMGGYGPNQYLHLLTNNALELKPKSVICGLYFGDDFDNAFRITYGLPAWAELRKGGLPNVDPDIWEKQDTTAPPTFQKRVRVWLSENSVLYKIVVHGLLQNIKGRVQIANAARIYPDTTALILPEKKIQEAFRPKGVLRGLDQSEAGVREGMRLTSEMLQRMKSICDTNKIEFTVVIIPTKETVFSRYLMADDSLPMAETLKKVIAAEKSARSALFENLSAAGIRFIDTYPALEKASETNGIYTFAATDMHPNKNGYRVIAETIHAELQSAQTNVAAVRP